MPSIKVDGGVCFTHVRAVRTAQTPRRRQGMRAGQIDPTPPAYLPAGTPEPKPLRKCQGRRAFHAWGQKEEKNEVKKNEVSGKSSSDGTGK